MNQSIPCLTDFCITRNPSTFGHETQDILTRTKKLDKKLDSPSTEVLASFAGLRPSREGGARIERTDIPVNGVSKILVHNYGAGGTGFQAGYGMALDAVATVETVLKAIGGGQAKL
jgi:D-amino-acid oxidase